MKKFKVNTPKNKHFDGTRLGVKFNKGEAIADLNENTVNVFKSWGYEVEEIMEKKETPKKVQPIKPHNENKNK